MFFLFDFTTGTGGTKAQRKLDDSTKKKFIKQKKGILFPRELCTHLMKALFRVTRSSSDHALPFFSPSSFHTISPSPAFANHVPCICSRASIVEHKWAPSKHFPRATGRCNENQERSSSYVAGSFFHTGAEEELYTRLKEKLVPRISDTNCFVSRV